MTGGLTLLPWNERAFKITEMDEAQPPVVVNIRDAILVFSVL
jgi:hypothetical protein